MCFNRLSLKNWIFLCLSLGFILSCNIKVGEQPPDLKIPEFKSNSCLSQSTDSFSKYFSGTASVDEIGAAWNCIAFMVQDFKNKVRCKKRDECTPKEISTFIEDNFIDENLNATVKQTAISEDLQIQFMKIKKLFLGGNTEFITPSELDGLVQTLLKLKDLFVELNPSMKILTFNSENQLKTETTTTKVFLFDFDEVSVNFVKFTKNFSQLINKGDNFYSFDDMYSFLFELSAISKKSWSWLDQVKSYLPVVKKLKKSITGGSEEIIKGQEWDLFLVLGARGYIQYLRYYYFIKSINPDYSSLKLAYIARTFEESFLTIYELLNYKESHQILKSEMEEIFISISNVWKAFKTSPELVSAIMKVKQILLGGGLESFSKEDFLKAQQKVNVVRDIVEKFNPYYQFYGMTWNPNQLSTDDILEFIRKGGNNSNYIVNKFVDEFKLENGITYQELTAIIAVIEKTYWPEKKDSFSEKLGTYACMVEIGTDILVDKNNFTLAKKCNSIGLSSVELGVLLKKVAFLYSQWLSYKYIYSNSEILKENQIQKEFKNFILSNIDFVFENLKNRRSKLISYLEIDGIFSELKKLEYLKGFTVETLSSITKVMVKKFFIEPGQRLGGRDSYGVDFMTLDYLKKEFLNYYETQLQIEDIYENKNKNYYNYSFILSDFRSVLSNTEDVFLKFGIQELLGHFSSVNPISTGENGRLIFTKNSNVFFPKEYLKQMNLNRFISGLLIRAYAKSLDRIFNYAGVNACEAKEAFLDIQPIIKEIGLIDATTGTEFIDSRFIEANLFLPHSDGNDLISFLELADISNFIFSGFKIDDEVKTLLTGECKFYTEGATKLIDLECLRNVYRKYSTTVLASLPVYLNYLQKEDPKSWEQAFFNNLKSAGYIPRKDMKVPTGDASLFPHILQYGESVFLKFDKNYDGFINKSEAFDAYPYFAGLLNKVAKPYIDSGTIKADELEALFTFILKYGIIPECSQSFTLFCIFESDIRSWLDWKSNYKKQSYDFMAGRSQFAKVVGLIADLVKAPTFVKINSVTSKGSTFQSSTGVIPAATSNNSTDICPN